MMQGADEVQIFLDFTRKKLRKRLDLSKKMTGQMKLVL